MRLLPLAAAGLALTLPAPALATGTSSAALARQVKTLNRQVAAMSKRIERQDAELTLLNGTLTSIGAQADGLQVQNDVQQRQLAYLNDKDTCGTVVTWDVLGSVVAFLTGVPQPRLADGGACARIGVARPGVVGASLTRAFGSLARALP